MNFFSEKPSVESGSSTEKENSQESRSTGFVGWLGKKLQNADQAVSAAASPEGGEIGKAMNHLLNLKKEDYRNAAIGLGVTSLAAVLLLNGGRMALSAAIPGMEHMAFSGINPDDLASIPGSIIDSLGHVLGMGAQVDVAPVAPPVETPVVASVTPEASLEHHGHHHTEVIGDNSDNERGPSYRYDKDPQNPLSGKDDNSSILFKKEEANPIFVQDSLNQDKNAPGSASYEEIIKSMKQGDKLDLPVLNTDSSSGTPAAENIIKTEGAETPPATQVTPEVNPEVKPAAPSADQAAASAGKIPDQVPATPEEKTAEILKSSVGKDFTGEDAKNNAGNIANSIF